MPRDVTNPKQNARFKRAEDARMLRKREALQGVMSTALGREFVWGFIESCGIYEGGFDPNGSHLYFMQGIRSVGIALRADVMANAFGEFEQMEAEARERDAAEARFMAQAETPPQESQ